MVIDGLKCTECGICVDVCTPGAIDLESKRIDETICMECGHCLALCPEGAVSHPGKAAPLFGDLPSPSQFESLVLRRRSCRNYLDKPIPPELIRSLMDSVRYAPTGTNTQAVGISLTIGREGVKEFADAAYRFLNGLARLSALFAPLLALVLGLKRAGRILAMKRHLSRHEKGVDIITWGAPALIAFHAPRFSSTPEEDCVIWATTLVYHAETLGLGSCWNGVIKNAARFNRGLRRMLGVPKGHRLYSVLILGYPKYKPYRGVIREETKATEMK
jgi:nitroreductase/Pyruvate/2-oxoacid:ferredoxin oxidoreductase delta subunit